MTATFDLFMRQAIDLAARARAKGNHPFGALLLHQGQVILTAENTVNTGRDVTGHAELNLVSQASQQFSRDILAESILVTSTEPCAMCAGAIYWAGISSVVFGCPAEKLGQITGGGEFVMPCAELLARGRRTVQVIGPVLEAEAMQVHAGFWNTP